MIVATFPKNNAQEVRAQLQTIEGRKVASLWVFGAKQGGGAFPTKHGISLSVESLPDLEEAVRELREAAKNPASFQ